MQNTIHHFTVRRDAPLQQRWSSTPLPDAASLALGEALLAIDLFSFTANNVTYAMFGEKMHYWNFFPTDDAAFGTIPVWGFATVVASKAEGVAVGERFYGYYPMSTHLKVNAERVGAQGFTDGSAHRRELPGIYNQYLRTHVDVLYRADREAIISILRPLFVTSFLLDDFLADNRFFGATQAVLSSASSKTAYGMAACLAARGGIELIGLTSTRNVDFVKSLGCYSHVVTYDALHTIDATTATVYTDFAGNASLRQRLHMHFGDALKYSCSIGGTHWEDLGGARDLPGPAPTLFFAPHQAKKRLTDWGGATFQAKLSEAWERFIAQVNNEKSPWMTVMTSCGQDAMSSAVTQVMKGEVNPAHAHVLRFE
jgi:Protein of unknown function (DUF2855)